MSYTKGEWTASKTYDFDGTLVSYIECGKKCVARTCLLDIEASEDENQANAQLIAAAPEMYEALKKLRDQFRELVGILLKHGQTDLLYELKIGRGQDRYGNGSACDKADRALTKADGKQ